MAQPAKLTKTDVRDALAHFRAQGVAQPGLHRLRNHIGHGSLTRMRRLLEEIERDELEAPPGGGVALPDPIQELVGRLWSEMDRALEGRESELEARTKAREDDAAAQVEVCVRQIQGLEQQRDGLASDLHQVRAELEIQREALGLEKATSTGLRQDLEGERKRNDLLQERIRELRADLAAQAKDHAEREAVLRAEVDGERTRSAELHRSQQRRLDEGEAARRLERDRYAQEREQWAQERERLLQRLEGMEQSQGALQAEAVRLQNELTAAREEAIRHRVGEEASTRLLQRTTDELERARAEAAAQAQRADRLRLELQKAKRRGR